MRIISQVGGRLSAYYGTPQVPAAEVGVSAVVAVCVTAATRGLRPDRVAPVVCAAARDAGP